MTSPEDESAGLDRDPEGGARQAWRISKLEREVAELRAANKILKDVASYLALSQHPPRPLPHQPGRGRGSQPSAAEDDRNVVPPDPEADDGAPRR